MNTPINLNQARKSRARAARRKTADENAVRFGRSKSQKKLEEVRAQTSRTHLDRHLRDE